MLRLLIDENFDQRILRGLKLRMPSLDAVMVRTRLCEDGKPRRLSLPHSSAAQAVLYARLKKHGIIPLSVWRPRASWGGEKTWRIYAGV
jgi:hypothetical protein